MKVGSLVVFLGCPEAPNFENLVILWMPIKDEIYTIKNIGESANTSNIILSLEENIIGYLGGIEVGLPIEFFREVQPPMEISIESLIKEGELV